MKDEVRVTFLCLPKQAWWKPAGQQASSKGRPPGLQLTHLRLQTSKLIPGKQKQPCFGVHSDFFLSVDWPLSQCAWQRNASQDLCREQGN